MSLEIHAPKVDALARELAAATGEDIDTAVMRAVRGLARTPRSALFERLARLPALDRWAAVEPAPSS